MNQRLQPLFGAAAGAALLSLGALGWLSRDLAADAGDRAASRPSLLELLEGVGRSWREGGPGPTRRAPAPPAPRQWKSPLAGACRAVDPKVRRRLATSLARLPDQRQRVAIDPSNFGERFRRDAFGNPVDPTPRVVVLHETVYGIGSALNTFRTPHPRDEDQVSYHTLVGQRGEIIEAVDPGRRAFGAGNSAFNGQWVITNPSVGGSINNFALHLSLETPLDGEDAEATHSGYTPAQYDAAAVVLADWMRRFDIPAEAITTHRHVDLGGARADPRSFDWRQLEVRLAAFGLLC